MMQTRMEPIVGDGMVGREPPLAHYREMLVVGLPIRQCFCTEGCPPAKRPAVGIRAPFGASHDNRSGRLNRVRRSLDTEERYRRDRRG